jgi:hypothetical protein
LVAGTYTGDVCELLQAFGDSEFLEAKPTVESYLAHEKPLLRYIALTVLTLDWGCQEHRATCERLVTEDPDATVRSMALAGLGSLSAATQDPRVLQLLLDIIQRKSGDAGLRDTAYAELLSVMGRPPREWYRPPSRPLDWDKDVDWNRIREAEEIVRRSQG